MDQARNRFMVPRLPPAGSTEDRSAKEGADGGFWQNYRESGDRLCRGVPSFGGFREAVNKQFGAVESSAASTGKKAGGLMSGRCPRLWVRVSRR